MRCPAQDSLEMPGHSGVEGDKEQVEVEVMGVEV